MPSGRSWPTIETTSGGSAPSSSTLSAFAVWLGSAGFIGEVLDDGLALGVGLTRAIVPSPSSGSASARHGWQGRRHRRDLDRTRSRRVGSLATLIAATGLLHVFRGRPGLDDPIAEVGAAGGCPRDGRRGRLARPCRFCRRSVILLAVGVIGVIIVTGSSARTVGEFVTKSARMIPALFGRAFESLRRSDPGRTGRRSAPEPAMTRT